jgi:hypothetical protein
MKDLFGIKYFFERVGVEDSYKTMTRMPLLMNLPLVILVQKLSNIGLNQIKLSN